MQFTPAFLGGQALLWLGFLGGSFAAVLRLENEAAPWQTVPWLPYILSAAVGVAGVVLLRREKAAQSSESAASEGGFELVTSSLADSASKVAQLKSQLDEMTCEEVLEYIDTECVPSLADFADARMVISNRFGTAKYAEVMTEFASGERYLNRAWSAAADGYVDEVERSVGHANTFIAAAQAKLETA